MKVFALFLAAFGLATLVMPTGRTAWAAGPPRDAYGRPLPPGSFRHAPRRPYKGTARRPTVTTPGSQPFSNPLQQTLPPATSTTRQPPTTLPLR